MLSIWFVQFPSDAKVNPKSLRFFTISTGSPLNRINDITDNLGNLARLFADDTSLSYFGRNYDIMKSDINNGLSKLNEHSLLTTTFCFLSLT
jgi:hypothetical protein